MSLVNLGYTFYREIEGTDIDFGRDIVRKAKELKVDSEEYFSIEKSYKLNFKTVYPSLVIGLGYAHESSDNSDFKLGFLFDYTTGLPYIPGSSLKGVLRSLFPLDKDDNKLIWINNILDKDYDFEELYEIEKSIFGKRTTDSSSKDNAQTKDVFYDGYFETSKGSFLVDDNITPHPDEFKSPKPLKFLKIAPETKVILQFELKENSLISKEDRIKLYIEILLRQGLGAKTNVGYGELERILTEEEKAKEEEKRLEEERKIKEQNEKKRAEEQEALMREKEAKKQEVLNALLECKTLADGFKLLKDSFGKKPKPTEEEKAIIEEFYRQQKTLSNSDKKVFKKYGVS